MRYCETLNEDRSGAMFPKASVIEVKDSLSLRAIGATSNFSAGCQYAIGLVNVK